MFFLFYATIGVAGLKERKGSKLNKNKILEELNVVLLLAAIQERDGGVRERVS